VQSGYERDKGNELGELRVVLPQRCPAGDDGSECRVGVHGRRSRKTGPQIPLVVARCHRHGVSFTVYPPGHVPYGRTAMVPLDLQGRRVEPAEPDSSIATSGTMWEAVADAVSGLRWPETGGAVGSRRTQGRRLVATAALLGLRSEPRVREQVATVLGIATLTLHEAARRCSGLVGWRELAQLLLGLLERCRAGGLPRALLSAGHLTGLWGRPSRWDPGGGCLRVLV
jgi:hypothetical protein